MGWIRTLVQATSLALSLMTAAQAADAPASAPTGTKVVRYAFNAAETGFDPARISDIYSNQVLSHIFEAPLTYDYLARPAEVRPLTAAALPEHSADFTVWTVHIRPGIYFADDPAFKGVRRELTAADYAYAIKRYYDPRWKSPVYSEYREYHVLGLEELRQKALDTRRPFDYDAPVAGLQTPDRYTLRVTLGRPNPMFMLTMANTNSFGAVAREVVEAYGEDVDAHPVGTGPFRLAQWRRSSLIVLERNPGYRDDSYDAHPAADDAEGQALLARFKGRKLPMIDRLEFAIIEQPQPTWLSFLSRDFDLVITPLEYAPIAAPGGHLAPNLAKQGIQLERVLRSDHAYTYFNMNDPVVGATPPRRSRCAGPSRWPTTTWPRSTGCAAAWAFRPRPCWCPTPTATTRSRTSASASTTRPRPCWICMAMSTRTVTAGATCPTASPCCCATSPRATRPAASSTSCGAST